MWSNLNCLIHGLEGKKTQNNYRSRSKHKVCETCPFLATVNTSLWDVGCGFIPLSSGPVGGAILHTAPLHCRSLSLVRRNAEVVCCLERF